MADSDLEVTFSGDASGLTSAAGEASAAVRGVGASVGDDHGRGVEPDRERRRPRHRRRAHHRERRLFAEAVAWNHPRRPGRARVRCGVGLCARVCPWCQSPAGQVFCCCLRPRFTTGRARDRAPSCGTRPTCRRWRRTGPGQMGGAPSWPTESRVRRVDDGVAHRVDRLRLAGNAVAVPVAEFIGWRVIAALEAQPAR